jgi:hypothetical protein
MRRLTKFVGCVNRNLDVVSERKVQGRAKRYKVLVPGNRSQMTDDRKHPALVFCHQFSVLCPLYLSDT